MERVLREIKMALKEIAARLFYRTAIWIGIMIITALAFGLFFLINYLLGDGLEFDRLFEVYKAFGLFFCLVYIIPKD